NRARALPTPNPPAGHQPEESPDMERFEPGAPRQPIKRIHVEQLLAEGASLPGPPVTPRLPEIAPAGFYGANRRGRFVLPSPRHNPAGQRQQQPRQEVNHRHRQPEMARFSFVTDIVTQIKGIERTSHA